MKTMAMSTHRDRRDPWVMVLFRVAIGFLVGLVVGYGVRSFHQATHMDNVQPVPHTIPQIVAPPEVRVAIAPLVKNAFGEYTEITLMVVSDVRPRKGRILFFSTFQDGQLETPVAVRELPFSRLQNLRVGLWQTIPIGIVSFEPDLQLSKVVIVFD